MGTLGGASGAGRRKDVGVTAGADLGRERGKRGKGGRAASGGKEAGMIGEREERGHRIHRGTGRRMGDQRESKGRARAGGGKQVLEARREIYSGQRKQAARGLQEGGSGGKEDEGGGEGKEDRRGAGVGGQGAGVEGSGVGGVADVAVVAAVARVGRPRDFRDVDRERQKEAREEREGLQGLGRTREGQGVATEGELLKYVTGDALSAHSLALPEIAQDLDALQFVRCVDLSNACAPPALY